MAVKADLTTSDASGGTKHSQVVPLDWRKKNFGVGILCFVTGVATYSIEHSDDGTNWHPNSNINGATADADTNYFFPVEYVRLTQTAGAGSVLAQVRQGDA